MRALATLVVVLLAVFPSPGETGPGAPPPRASFPGAAPPAARAVAAEKTKAAAAAAYTTHFFPQLLDHFTFRPEGSRIFYQKYLVDGRHWDRRSAGPIFVYTGNEGNIEWFAENTGFLLDIAPKFRALLVFIEVSSSSHGGTSRWRLLF